MSNLDYSVQVVASLMDRNGKVLQQASKEVGAAGQQVPFVEDSVILKVPVPAGSEFQVTVLVDGEESVSYRGVVPIPYEMQQKLAEALKQAKRKTSFISQRGDILNATVPDWAFVVDIWQKMRIAPHGFVEFEVHVGQEGIGTPKWIAHSQFWVNVSG
ncbi:MAG: hypothetical protein KIS92_21135 [Planctomycetota bacterium]|nr:hypothetical protein [Planctomycetota bacterium]